MANPAPTLNQINAFNATIGTTIDFNIIGGTEVIRSNRIYIYDLSDNSLICTHLYVSTESIHELPANTDSSIVYESGKSSADFVNGAQYYAQIQTFTDVGGTQGGSGLSIAKLFWCLPTPTLTLSTIPTTISTTSYNVSATYNANTSVVSNIIQQYQFSLYNATGSLLQSSGVVVGNGEQQGTSTAYDISYNFIGLSVGSSYYVVVNVTTTQGMSVSAQSGTFTVSIDTPTLGEATVVNNACDGYISVTSNLSSEYGGSGSGEIVSFETDSENVFTKLQVDLEPVQNGTPWIGTETDNTPYTFRAVSESSAEVGNREYDKIVGGTVAWNQLLPDFDASNWSLTANVTSVSDGELHVQPTATWQGATKTNVSVIAGHKYFESCVGRVETSGTSVSIGDGLLGVHTIGNIYSTSNTTIATIVSATATITGFYNVGNRTGVANYYLSKPQLIDLTAMFGSVIADYIYNLEQSSVGAGVAWFKKLFPKDYYEYNAGELLSVEGLESHNTVGFNQWDEEWELGGIDSSGNTSANTDRIRSKNFVPILPNTAYYFKVPNAWRIFYYDADMNFISYIGTYSANRLITTPNNAHYLKFYCVGTTYNHDICINLSDASLNGTYKPHVKHSYPLDSDLTLRGIPKLDASNNLYYDGDTYESDGTVTRKYGYKLFDGTNTAEGKIRFTEISQVTTADGTKYVAYLPNNYGAEQVIKQNGLAIATGYDWSYNVLSNLHVGEFNTRATYTRFVLKDQTITSLSALDDYFANNPMLFIYELDTPTTETADPYTNPQVVDPDGTEEYVTTSIVPVGHESSYADVYPISGYDSVTVTVADDATNPTESNVYTTNLGRTVYGGTVDLVSGLLTVDRGYAYYDGSNDENWRMETQIKDKSFYIARQSDAKALSDIKLANMLYSTFPFSSQWIVGSCRITAGYYNFVVGSIVGADSVAEWRTYLANNPIGFTYELATPQTYQLTPQQIQTLVGQNNVWSEDGDVEITYNIPITNLLVKRQDVADVSGDWLTLYSQPITQASDMDFTFVDFTNQYGKTYKYALVPLLTQTQSGVIVQIEGGYTVSDNVDSIFDGVYIADQTNVERVKAGVGYGNVDMNQNVGTITPIGSKYPIVVTNSQNQYHNGSIRGKIVPNDFYSNGNLSRIDMVNKRDELEQFLTNKRAKIIKDWNGKIWLVMILSNVACTFDDNYGMGMVEFSADWVEVGDPTTQQDLYNAGLINVGGA